MNEALTALDPASFERFVRELDTWVAGAFAIPEEYRYPDHEQILDRCAGLVIWLDTKREPIPVCLPVIAKVMPLMRCLDGGKEWPGHVARMDERRRIEEALKQLQHEHEANGTIHTGTGYELP